MNMLSVVMNIISALLSTYMILIIIRIFLTWFKGNTQSKAIQILKSVVDPYLDIFKRIEWLRVGAMDFSPIVAMIILGLFVQITSSIAQTGHFTALMLISYLVYSLWSFVSFILDILVIMMVIRLISKLISNKSHQIWFIVDNILNRVMAKILGIFTNKPVSFKRALIICGLSLFAVRMGLYYAIGFLMAFLNNLA
ncbi:MAG: YggT family protein [Spirochaetaceae bacterium]|jgi:YggT family protein|nr:YggT family protein [Spirochaetaceae bacterium]